MNGNSSLKLGIVRRCKDTVPHWFEETFAGYIVSKIGPRVGPFGVIQFSKGGSANTIWASTQLPRTRHSCPSGPKNDRCLVRGVGPSLIFLHPRTLSSLGLSYPFGFEDLAAEEKLFSPKQISFKGWVIPRLITRVFLALRLGILLQFFPDSITSSSKVPPDSCSFTRAAHRVQL